jgi:Asp-tRNA(Asn)/Glu-tRNA(Gln) amidotransferase B subunit
VRQEAVRSVCANVVQDTEHFNEVLNVTCYLRQSSTTIKYRF